MTLDSLISKALSGGEAPTPGYLFKEIAQTTYTSRDACVRGVKKLVAALRSNDPNARLKALLVIKHAAPAGDAFFRRLLQQEVQAVKE